MTKEKFVELIDIQEGDKIYYVRIRQGDDNTNEHRMCIGMSATEIIGLLEKIKIQMVMQVVGQMEPPDKIQVGE